jgi:hypothetical protein
MTNAPIARGQLTGAVFTHLQDGLNGDVLVGRGAAPEAGGWSNGQAGVGSFKDYVVLKTGTASTPAPGQPERLAALRTSWVCSYRLTFHGTKESSVDLRADMARALMVTLPEQFTLDGVDWTLQRVEYARLGDTRPDNSTDPAHWTVTDDVSLHLSRVQTR